MARETIRRPAVEVRQVFEGRTPPALTPVLQAALVGINRNIVVQLEVGRLTAAATVTGKSLTLPIPTGDAQITAQTIDSDSVEVYLLLSNGDKYLLDASDYTLSLSSTVNTITFPATPTVSRIIASGIAEQLSNVTGSSGTEIGILTDEEAQFTASKVAPGDILTFEDNPDDSNSTQFNLDGSGNSLEFRVLEVSSDSQLKVVRNDTVTPPDSNGFVSAETDVSYSINRTVADATGTILISYKSIRLDNVYTFYEFESVDEVISALGSPVPENPLAFACVLALTNTVSTIAAVKVAADGVVEHQRALELLENREVYGLVPLTFNSTIQDAYIGHVDAMSAPQRKKERVTFICRDMPAFVTRTNVSGTQLDSPVYFDAAYSAGSPSGMTRITIPATDDDAGAIDLTDTQVGDIVRVKRLSGGTGKDVTLTSGYTVDNDDVILQIANKGADYVDVIGEIDFVTDDGGVTDWTIGTTFKAALTTRNFTSLQGAEYYGDIGESILNRRVFLTYPDTLSVNVTRKTTDSGDFSVSTVTLREDDVPGYFLGASLAGQTSELLPSQPRTNLPILGFVGLTGSNDALSETALDTMATGGVWIAIQESAGSNVTTRHQLSTDATSIEKREASITFAADFTAKVFRAYLKGLVGSNNITKRFIRNVVQPTAASALRLVTEGGVIGNESRILNIQQSDTSPDTILIDVDMVPLYPVNNITVTLFI